MQEIHFYLALRGEIEKCVFCLSLPRSAILVSSSFRLEIQISGDGKRPGAKIHKNDI
jgi:hypothetical protein